MMEPFGIAIAIQEEHRRRIERVNSESWKYQDALASARGRFREALISRVRGQDRF
jgi:hypothetical protein